MFLVSKFLMYWQMTILVIQRCCIQQRVFRTSYYVMETVPMVLAAIGTFNVIAKPSIQFSPIEFLSHYLDSISSVSTIPRHLLHIPSSTSNFFSSTHFLHLEHLYRVPLILVSFLFSSPFSFSRFSAF